MCFASILLVCILMATGCDSKQQEYPEYFAAEGCSEFVCEVEGYLESCSFNGAVLVSVDGEPLYASGFGYADEKSDVVCNAADTFEIGSLSKQFTAAAILMLYEDGLLDLDDSIDTYFPQFEQGQSITVRNLLNMRSGLYDYINDAHKFFPADYVEEYLAKADSDSADTPDFERSFLLQYLYSAPIRNTPDTDFYYCNTDYYLLGLIIEQVSGMSYQEYLEQNIFIPCDMLTANNDFMGTTTRGYYADGSTLSMRTSTALGCGSVNAGVYDLYRWYTQLYSGKLINEASLSEMTTSVGGYGFGVICSSTLWYHGGSTNVFNSFSAFYPQDDLLIIVLSNSPIENTSTTYVAKNIWEIYTSISKDE